ncbi:50S ribosomal protein L25/general stress protein Ctc, partial [bacterium]|nr:50S ribosomal protein L25/general stress protein Ctc [bacterium]
MEQITVQSSVRELKGKGPNRRLRVAGKIPAVLYGHKSQNMALEVDPKDIFKILHSDSGENTIFQLEVPGKEKINVLIKEYQLEPVSHRLLHADFYEVAMDEVLEVDVPLEVIGEAYGVKTEGGLLDIVHRELRVECLPADIPENIEVDVTELKIGDHLRVKDLKISEKIKILDDPETVVVAVEHPRAEEPV